jgi:hypothetical protein
MKGACHLQESVDGVAAVVLGVFVEWMAEGRYDVQDATGGEDAFHFAHDGVGMIDVLKDGVTLDALEEIRGERQVGAIGDDIDSWDAGDIEVDEAGDLGAGSADVEVVLA